VVKKVQRYKAKKVKRYKGTKVKQAHRCIGTLAHRMSPIPMTHHLSNKTKVVFPLSLPLLPPCPRPLKPHL